MAGSKKTRSAKKAQYDLPVEDQDKALQCEDCLTWWHASCQQIADYVYDVIATYDQFRWFCRQCNPLLELKLKESADLLLLKETVRKLQEDMEDCRRDIAKIDSVPEAGVGPGHPGNADSIKKLSTKLSTLEKEITEDLKTTKATVASLQSAFPKIQEKMQDFIDEQDQRFKRMCNIIVFNIPECSAETGEERKAFDKQCVHYVLEKLGLAPMPVDPVIRLGRFVPHRTRPLRFTVSCTSVKHTILSAARNHTIVFPDNREELPIRIYPDRTPAERTALQAQRQARDPRTSTSPGRQGQARPSGSQLDSNPGNSAVDNSVFHVQRHARSTRVFTSSGYQHQARPPTLPPTSVASQSTVPAPGAPTANFLETSSSSGTLALPPYVGGSPVSLGTSTSTALQTYPPCSGTQPTPPSMGVSPST